MFLKTLQIKGFKSFADVATLELEPGVTVVVGPNGSGKSNVVDAIGWVLGAQAPSAVRSQKMDDVIFAGSTKRPALGRAEVSLTIDNTSRILPIDFLEVTISRTLFRSGDSEYAINGVACRLLDIQELLSDSGVGRQQHVIISQGQIDAVLNARPEDRRLIIEEAAGVLKFRRRKEKAERRLSATEANLTRIQDLLREVRRQLRPLERQADAAKRHGAVVAELDALRLYLAGRELVRLRTTLAASIAEQGTTRSTERECRSALARLDTAVLATEAELSAMGGGDFSDALLRHESLLERGRGLGAVLDERRRGLERERSASVDQALVASLEAESAQLASELSACDADVAATAVDQSRLAEAELELVAARERFDADWAEGVAAATGEAAEVRAEASAVRSALERGAIDRRRLETQQSTLAGRERRLETEAERSGAEHAAAAASLAELATSLPAARQSALNAAAALIEAETVADTATAERHRWLARAEALASALDEARSRAGAEHLAGLDGVVGTLLDVIEIDAGWEAAVEVALADALGAVVVESPAAARRGLEELVGAGRSGALVALGVTRRARTAPSVGESVRAHVRSNRSDVDGLLDSLIGHAVRVEGDWTAAIDVAISHPDAIVVTSAGDRFGSTGWAVGISGSGATGAALAEATEQAERTASAADEAVTRVSSCRADNELARARDTELTRALQAAESSLETSAAGVERLVRERAEAAQESETLSSHLADLDQRAVVERERLASLEARLPALEEIEAARSDRERAVVLARSELDERASAVGVVRSDVEVKLASTAERRRSLVSRIAALDGRLSRHEVERLVAARHRLELDARVEVVDALIDVVRGRLGVIEAAVEELRGIRRRQAERTRLVASRLDGLRRERSEHERELEVARERLQRAEIADAETKLRLEAATEALRRDLDVEPERAIEAEQPQVADGVSPVARVRELERDLRLMGPINPLALEEFAALNERHELLEAQMDDVRQARRELAKIIKAVDEEIVNVFSAAFADVAANFVKLFETLFPGGVGGLKLTEPHDLLNTGIEIEAKPSGKNVKKLSLLSGGERSLTALAYLFAVFRSRPSPFYVMDEVEAALDDVNLHRFLGLVAEFRNDAQLLIVSHQKRTMEAADVLYGVTMEPGGSSKVLSERVAATLD